MRRGAAVAPGCLAGYQATAERQLPSFPGAVTVVLHSRFLAATDQRDECFGSSCYDYVPVAQPDARRLHYPQAVRISAGDGRVLAIGAGATAIRTLDAPGAASLIVGLPELLTGLYFIALTGLFAAGYVLGAMRTGLWRMHPVRWLRALTIAQVLSDAASLASFAAFAAGGSGSLVILGVVMLTSFVAALIGRVHREPPMVVPIGRPKPREVAFANRHRGPLILGFYLLAVFPALIGLNMALRFLISGPDADRAAVAAASAWRWPGSSAGARVLLARDGASLRCPSPVRP